MCVTGRKRIKPIEYGGTLWYQCGMCGEWSNHIEHMTNDQQLFENIWDEVNIHQMHGHGTYCILTINNMSKPFVCACCIMWEGGMGKNMSNAIDTNKTTQQLVQLVEMSQYMVENIIYSMECH